jgi:protein-tyrosine phosphatase
VRTSKSSPICVNFLAPEDTGVAGAIGLTIAPGKHDGFTARDLDADLERLRDEYKCDVLVSLMEPEEYEWLGIAGLFERAAGLGIEVVRFPIEDASAPRPREMPDFVQLIAGIVAAARAGRTVVIHCRGGLGRTGTVAAACLVALGHAPWDSIERVRLARPGAVETVVQERWVEAFADATAEGEMPG